MSFSKPSFNYCKDVLDNLDLDDISADFLNVFSYTGFDPVAMIKAMMDVCAKAGEGEAGFKKDIAQLAILGATRGNNISDIMKKTNHKGKNTVAAWQRKYKIRGILSGKSLDPAEVTLSRVMSVCSATVAKWIKINTDYIPVANVSQVAPDYPLYCQYPTFGCLIPTSVLDEALIDLLIDGHCYHQYCFSFVVTKKKPVADRPSKNEIKGYVVIQQETKIIDNSTRLRVLSDLGVIKKTSTNEWVLDTTMSQCCVSMGKAFKMAPELNI